MKPVARVQVQNEAACVSLGGNVQAKGVDICYSMTENK